MIVSAVKKLPTVTIFVLGRLVHSNEYSDILFICSDNIRPILVQYIS